MTEKARNDSQQNYQESLTKLPQLADAAIRLNLQEELNKLRSAPTWAQPTGRSSATLVKYEDLRMVLTLMRKGSRIAQHRAEGSISIQAIQGRLRLYVGRKEICELVSGDVLALQSGLEHDVEALEESAFLLTIASNRPSPAEM
jgi:quercetin dioxygenase-like cupin family protein